MESREELPATERRRFQTGRPCLDLTHTGGEGVLARWEIVNTPDGAARYLGIILDSPPPAVLQRDMEMIRGLRGAITAVARALADDADHAFPDAAVATLNTTAAHRPLDVELSVDHQLTVMRGDAGAACSTLARDAIDLFSSPLRRRIRICEADDCGLLFVDTSRPGRRRWCSMEWCGDRQKKRRAGRPVR